MGPFNDLLVILTSPSYPLFYFTLLYFSYVLLIEDEDWFIKILFEKDIAFYLVVAVTVWPAPLILLLLLIFLIKLAFGIAIVDMFPFFNFYPDNECYYKVVVFMPFPWNVSYPEDLVV